MNDLLSLSRMARRLGVTQQWLRDHADAGESPCLKAGNRYLFNPVAVEEALAAKASRTRSGQIRQEVRMIDLTKLAEPFPIDDVEWRVSNAGRGSGGLYCMVVAYITARAIQQRLDDVCGQENWRNEEPRVIELAGKSAFAGGISIRCADCWLTKWDVAEPTNIEPAKGGFSGAMKRAGAQWGIGRYLYHLKAVFADVTEEKPASARNWNKARLPKDHGGGVYWWQTPSGLPAWALPKDPEHEISVEQLSELKRAWRDKFAADSKSPKELREGFSRFVASVVGEFPASDYTCWTLDAHDRCMSRIEETTEPDGISADVPFAAAK